MKDDGESMENVRFGVCMVDGSYHPLGPTSGADIIDAISDDWGKPVTAYVIDAETDDGRLVTISIPYNKSRRAFIRISDGNGKSA